jgi:hypothetical protein
MLIYRELIDSIGPSAKRDRRGESFRNGLHLLGEEKKSRIVELKGRVFIAEE